MHASRILVGSSPWPPPPSISQTHCAAPACPASVADTVVNESNECQDRGGGTLMERAGLVCAGEAAPRMPPPAAAAATRATPPRSNRPALAHTSFCSAAHRRTRPSRPPVASTLPTPCGPRSLLLDHSRDVIWRGRVGGGWSWGRGEGVGRDQRQGDATSSGKRHGCGETDDRGLDSFLDRPHAASTAPRPHTHRCIVRILHPLHHLSGPWVQKMQGGAAHGGNVVRAPGQPAVALAGQQRQAGAQQNLAGRQRKGVGQFRGTKAGRLQHLPVRRDSPVLKSTCRGVGEGRHAR